VCQTPHDVGQIPPILVYRGKVYGGVYVGYKLVQDSSRRRYHQFISGYSDGTFRPGNNATRGQISKIVYLAITSP
jgi:hypothetical protein